MPVFRIPREHLEIEVSLLENQGFRDLQFTPDGKDVLAYCNPLWQYRPGYRPDLPPPDGPHRLERPDWVNDLERRSA